MRNGVSGFTAILLLLIAIQPRAADERDHRRGIERERRAIWHGDIHRFHEQDLALWRAGRWYHGRRDGRYGWWWIAGGIWYSYPAPIYPFPDPYLPPGAVAPIPGAAQQYWYYCANPAGYYPYVAECGTLWQPVPANVQPGRAPTLPNPAPVPPAPPAPPSAPAPGAQQYWYYCTNPPGYYPTVPECRSGWQRVPASAPPGVTR